MCFTYFFLSDTPTFKRLQSWLGAVGILARGHARPGQQQFLEHADFLEGAWGLGLGRQHARRPTPLSESLPVLILLHLLKDLEPELPSVPLH